MANAMKLLFLGSGTSTGVPMIGCDCPVCRSADPRDKRLRSSAYLSAGDLRVLIDTSPDFRQQALRADIRRVDAVLVTHAHVDHLFGLDDIRRINTVQGGAVMPLYASSSALDDIRRIFDYVFKPNVPGTYRPKLDLRPSDAPLSIPCPGDGCGEALSVTPVPVTHGWTVTQGFRFDFGGRSLAYMPDLNELPDGSRALVRGIDVLVIDTLRHRPHPTHLTLEQSLEIIADIRPGRAFLTHLCHDLAHAALVAELDARGLPNVRPACDGLEIEV